jgi:ubiquinol-cytochrome c reductase core subunit 2
VVTSKCSALPPLTSRAYFLSLLSSVLSSTYFHKYEYSELVLPTIQAEVQAATSIPSTLALDVAHQLAFRRGLGNSLFASPHSEVTAEQVKNFAQTAFAKSNLAVIGTGISTEALTKAVNSAFGAPAAGGSSAGLATPATTYYGGEQRIPIDPHAGASAQPTLLIAYGSKNTGSADLCVLSALLGGTTNVKWSPGSSPLAQAAASVPGAEAKAFLLPYSDASLFGVTITAPTSEGVKTVSTKVAELLKAFKPSAEHVKRAVANARFQEALKSEKSESVIATVGTQVSLARALDD